jgi:hypothetical protein
MALPTEFLIIVGSYLGVFLLAMFLFNFLMAGFLRTYLAVKASRGAKVLVQVVTVARNYYRTGKVEDGFLVYKDFNKHEKRLSIPRNVNVFYRTLNITAINVDEEKNTIILPHGEQVTGYDAEKMNSLYLRALYRPEIMSPQEQLTFILTIITALLTLVTVITLNFVIGKKINAIYDEIQLLKTYFVGLNATIM